MGFAGKVVGGVIRMWMIRNSVAVEYILWINIPKYYANTFDIGICYFILIIVDFRYDKCICKRGAAETEENAA